MRVHCTAIVLTFEKFCYIFLLSLRVITQIFVIFHNLCYQSGVVRHVGFSLYQMLPAKISVASPRDDRALTCRGSHRAVFVIITK